MFQILLFSPTFAQSKISVRVFPAKTVERDTVILGEIAEIRTNDNTKLQRLKEISLGYAPNVGATREIGREKIILAIAAAGFAENEIAVDAPKIILIKRRAQIISGAALREEIEKAVLRELQSENTTAKIVNLNLPEMLEMPAGKVSFKVLAGNVRNFFAPFAVSVEIRVGEKVIRRLSVSVEIEAFAEILVATKDLSANTKISEADFRLEKRRLLRPLANYLSDINDLRGKVLVKNLINGTELTKDSIISGIIVKTGDTVKIISKSGGIQISIVGEARANGRIGDKIAVKNTNSGALLQAVIIDEGLVEVRF